MEKNIKQDCNNMKQITEFLSTRIAKPSIIKATTDNIKDIVESELKRLGPNANLNHIDTSNVNGMPFLFAAFDVFGSPRRIISDMYEDLNPDISEWDTSNVVTFYSMFSYCKSFNCDITGWNTKKLLTTERMFNGCESFNQDISGWNIRNVTSMDFMFVGCSSFNQDLSHWDLTTVSHKHMFDKCPIKEEFKPKFK